MRSMGLKTSMRSPLISPPGGALLMMCGEERDAARRRFGGGAEEAAAAEEEEEGEDIWGGYVSACTYPDTCDRVWVLCLVFVGEDLKAMSKSQSAEFFLK